MYLIYSHAHSYPSSGNIMCAYECNCQVTTGVPHSFPTSYADYVRHVTVYKITLCLRTISFTSFLFARFVYWTCKLLCIILQIDKIRKCMLQGLQLPLLPFHRWLETPFFPPPPPPLVLVYEYWFMRLFESSVVAAQLGPVRSFFPFSLLSSHHFDPFLLFSFFLSSHSFFSSLILSTLFFASLLSFPLILSTLLPLLLVVKLVLPCACLHDVSAQLGDYNVL